jgi:hypothetical protein
MWDDSCVMEDLLQPFRLSNEAVQLRRFTAADLAAAAKSTLSAAQKFINRLDNENTEAFTKERLASGRRGNPVMLYRLTSTGIRMLAREIAPMQLLRLSSSRKGREIPCLAEDSRSGYRFLRTTWPWLPKRAPLAC